MEFLTLLLIAVSLSFDSFAVSICSGLSLCGKKKLKISQSIKIALVLAIFQGTMPVLGWLLGSTFNDFVKQADHWIAFGLLSVLGIKMIIEGNKPVHRKEIINPSHFKILLPMAIATSIDAFAVGISFSFFLNTILFAAILIGAVTFIISLSGLYLGKKIGIKIAGKAEIAGGIILIAIGTKIVIEHLFFQPVAI
ncbi:MAG: manganese efflux pump MntP family protein [Prolixibacteraceae bacterium]|nr:manganese efflux pump MntP family protein [Prolixibacteraceae bacterium]